MGLAAAHNEDGGLAAFEALRLMC